MNFPTDESLPGDVPPFPFNPQGLPGYNRQDPTDYPDPYTYHSQYASRRTRIPAILMIAVGVFGLLFSLYLSVNTVLSLRMTVEDYQKQIEGLGFRENQFKGWSYSEMKRAGDISNLTITMLAFPTALLQLVGGIRLLIPRSFGLVLVAALTACVPCINITGCCGFGQLAGIWTLIVLMDPAIRQAFNQSFVPFQYPPYPPS